MVGACCWAAAAGAALAEEQDTALRSFARPVVPASPRSGPADGIEWERRLRMPALAAPFVPTPADAALLSAARVADWSRMLELLKSGMASANARNLAGGDVLGQAARAGQDELVRELLRRGADIDRVGNDGFTALGAAAFNGHRNTVRLLVRAGADVGRLGSSGQGALHLAGLAGQIGVLEEFLRLKVDIEGLNRQRESVLDVTAAAGQLDAMTVLIAAGANANRAGAR